MAFGELGGTQKSSFEFCYTGTDCRKIMKRSISLHIKT